MKKLSLFCSIVLCRLLSASTVVISSLPDPARPLEPLSFGSGLPLSVGSEIRVGAFPNLTSSDLIDTASAGGLPQILAAFVQFGETATIGTGAEETPGIFEIAVREANRTPAPSWDGEAIAVLITSPDNSEFLVARFPSELFTNDSSTSLETLTSLHLADAQLILGQNLGPFSFTTSAAPELPSFPTWINQYTAITDPNLRELDADPDGDGRSNFLEYATGGDPLSMNDPSPAQIVIDPDGLAWFRISVLSGIGLNQFQIESAPGMHNIWIPTSLPLSLDPFPPFPSQSLRWLRIPVLADQATGEFFRLKVTSD